MNKWWTYFFGGVAAGIGAAYYATRIEPTWLQIKRTRIPIAGLPKSFDGFRIVLLSDFHYSYQRNLPLHFLQEIVDRVNALEPSLIALAGDFVHDHSQVSVDAGFLSSYLARMIAPYGKFAVLGNHDYAFFHKGYGDVRDGAPEMLIDCLEEADITVLRNESRRIESDGESIQLVGFDDLDAGYFDDHQAMHGINPNKTVIGLCHNPDAVVHFWRKHPMDLFMCGHTHGGQGHLPFIPIPRSVRHSWRTRGHSFEEGIHIYISKGVGWGLHKMRFNARPEITLLTLKKA